MQVFLLKDIKDVGQKGQIINVKLGYFRNFLAPRQLGLVANPNLIQKSKSLEQKRSKKLEEIVHKAAEIKTQLKDAVLNFKKKAGKTGKLYGSVTEKDLIDGLKNHYQLELEPENIVLSEHLKKVGEHQVTIKLTDAVSFPIAVNIAAE